MAKTRKRMRRVGAVLAGEAALGALALFVADSLGGEIRIGHDREKAGFLRGVREAVANYVGEFHPEDFITREVPTAWRYFTQQTEAQPHEPLNIAQDPAAMNGTFLWQGFRLAFRDLPHRITWMESRVDGISAGQDEVAASAAVAFEGGDWSRVDGIEFDVRAQAVRSDDMAFVHASEAVSITGGRAVKRLVLNLADMGLAKKKHTAVLLRGFCFDTSAEHEDGMTIKGLGVRLEPRGREGDNLLVDVVLDFKAGPVAFRPDPGYDFNLDATVYYTVAGADSGAFVDAPAHYMLRNRERAPERVQEVSASLPSGLAAAAPALRGFSLDLHTTRARFLREIAVLLREPEYAPDTGNARVLCDAYCSNAGTAAGALDVRFNADLMFLCMDAGNTAPQDSVSGEMDGVTENTAHDLRAGI